MRSIKISLIETGDLVVTLKLNLSLRDYAHLCPKAASSFWTLNIVRLDPSKLNVTGYKMAHAAAPRKIGLPLAEVKNFSSLLSFAVVRHPFERLASAYFHKMIDMGHQVRDDRVGKLMVKKGKPLGCVIMYSGFLCPRE